MPRAARLGGSGLRRFCNSQPSAYPFVGVAFFPRTDPGQFVIRVKTPAGTRIELTDQYLARMEQDIRK